MIQRIQTLYLILGTLCLGSLIFLDAVRQAMAAATLTWYVPAVSVIAAVTSIVALVAVFGYKNRARQLKLVASIQILTLILMVVLYGALFLANDFARLSEGAADLSLVLILLLPIVAYLFFYLARRGIQRDEDLVKSMDRLR